MLTLLTIKDFALINHLQLDFDAGLTTLTGETGAGKSIMLDAIALVTGQRADSGVIREGAQQCEISAMFDVADNPVVQTWLTEQFGGLETSEVVLTRFITHQGRSKSLINGTACHLQTLRTLGECLIHIHGQHQQYHLLKPEVHRAQLDAYADHDALMLAVAQAYDTMHGIQRQCQQLQDAIQGGEQQQLLRYQWEELQDLQLAEDEVVTLHQEQRLLAQAQQHLTTLEQVGHQLDGDSNEALRSRIHHLRQSMESLAVLDNEHANTIIELLTTADVQLIEAASEVQQLQHQLSCDPSRLQKVEQRLTLIHDLARKHQLPAEQLWQHHQRLETRLQAQGKQREQLESLQQALEAAKTDYAYAAEQLTASRLQQAPRLANAIGKMIKRLGMGGGEVQVNIDDCATPTREGQDKVTYQVRLNPGSAFKPLAKIASGGELSRISLAIQVLIAKKSAFPTLIFDEVDTGIGGATAAKAGQLLRQLGQSAQVFCVTHQAQVASYGNAHLAVEKKTKKGQTVSTVRYLQGEERIKELARMISGAALTEETVAHAKSLLAEID